MGVSAERAARFMSAAAARPLEYDRLRLVKDRKEGHISCRQKARRANERDAKPCLPSTTRTALHLNADHWRNPAPRQDAGRHYRRLAPPWRISFVFKIGSCNPSLVGKRMARWQP